MGSYLVLLHQEFRNSCVLMSSHIYIYMTYNPLMVIITNFVVWYYRYHNIPHILKDKQRFFYSISRISLMRQFLWMMCCWIIAFSKRILFQTIPYLFLFSSCNVRYWEHCHMDLMSAAPSRIHGQIKPDCASAPVVFPINANNIFMWSHI